MTESLAQRLGAALGARGQRVATAESCTGGMVAAALTDVAGSSAWFGFGWVTYANEAKQQEIAVSPVTLATFGAVSEETVREMASGARNASGADFAIAISGIAGPGGGVPGKPVGTVWFAVAGPQGSVTRCLRFDGDRAAVRAAARDAALSLLLECVTTSA